MRELLTASYLPIFLYTYVYIYINSLSSSSNRCARVHACSHSTTFVRIKWFRTRRLAAAVHHRRAQAVRYTRRGRVVYACSTRIGGERAFSSRVFAVDM